MESLSRTKPLAHRTSSSRSKRLSSARSDGRSSHLVGRASLPTRVEADDAGSYARLGFDFSGLAVLERLFLRMPMRMDYGPVLANLERWFPDEADRQQVLWHTPARLFGFA